MPEINLLGADASIDFYWRPRVERSGGKATTKRFNGTKDSWTFRAQSFVNHRHQGKWEMRHVFQTGYELVVDQDELMTEFQTLAPQDAPICFRQAVIGLGSQCGLASCENNVSSDVYLAFRDLISDYYWDTWQTWERHLAGIRSRNKRQQQKQAHHNSSTNNTSATFARAAPVESSIAKRTSGKM
ncbi:hypothetical protein BGZ47_009203 [Haplosporangium gracile]|nr:hypothetical protein BGZ47_009203 [Haplosporangium gracile]